MSIRTRSSGRQAVETKYLGPTNTRGSRVRASCQAKSITVSWDYALNQDENHVAAARALLVKMEWRGTWVGGWPPKAHGMVFVQSRRP